MIGRIHERTIFARMRAEGKRVRSGFLWCSVILDPSLDGPCVAYAIGKRTGSAVVRNRIRRRLRPILSNHADALPKGYYLIGASNEAAHVSAQTLVAQVSELVAKVIKVAQNA